MTYKERTKLAIEELLKRYQFLYETGLFDEYGKIKEDELTNFIEKNHPDLYSVFFSDISGKYYPEKSCPFCDIYDIYNISCGGCINAGLHANPCSSNQSYYRNMLSMEERIEFWKKVLEHIDEIPAKYFTPSGWSYKRFQEFYKKYNLVNHVRE